MHGVDWQSEEHCYSCEAMCMVFTAVTKRSGVDGQNEEDLISSNKPLLFLRSNVHGFSLP